jgi:hypothetical protein
METPPFSKKAKPVLFNDSECLPGIGCTHVVVLPQGGSCCRVAEADRHLPSAGALHMDMWRLMLPGRRVDVDAKRTLFVDPDHAGSYNPALGSARVVGLRLAGDKGLVE